MTRNLDKIKKHKGVTVIVADDAWGAPYLIEALPDKDVPTVWISLSFEDKDDTIEQGNKLSDAVTRALDSQLFGHAMPYTYGLSILRDHIGLFEPISFALSGATYGEALATDLAFLQGTGIRVILSFEALPSEFLIPEDALLLQKDALRLSQEDALAIVEDRLNEVETQNLLRLVAGNYERFMLELHKRLGLPIMLRPSADKAELPPGVETNIPPGALLQVHIRRERWVEALEIATAHAPERVPDLLEKAGDAFLDRGLYGQLWRLLNALPSELDKDEAVLFWKLRAADRLGKLPDVQQEVAHHLKTHDTPDLRAFYATKFLPLDQSLLENEKAYSLAKTPITLQHYAVNLLFSKPEKSLELYAELRTLAQHMNPRHSVVALGGMAHVYTILGRYRESAVLYEEALRTFDTAHLGDWQFRNHLQNNWAYTRILLGETVGLSELLQKEERALREAFPALAFSYRATLGAYMLSQQRVPEALFYYQTNYDILLKENPVQGRDFRTEVVLDLIHAHIHNEDYDKARSTAEKHYVLSKADPFSRSHVYARIAYALALTQSEPERATELLDEPTDIFLPATELAMIAIHKAKALLKLGRRQEAKDTLIANKNVLTELADSGFYMLAGSQMSSREVYDLIKGESVPLYLSFLGEAVARLEGEPLKLTPKEKDIVAIIAMHPEGITAEALTLEVYGDEGSAKNIKSSLSKLRRHIPLTRPPYKLDIAYKADFLLFEQALKDGKLRAALELYKGVLLPNSLAPGIEETRELLEEQLRQAVLHSGDVEALLSLSERLKDDLELWEASIEALPDQDPRRTITLAKQKRVAEAWGL